MNPRLLGSALVLLGLTLAACGDDSVSPPAGPPDNPGGAFYEPSSTCFFRTQDTDSLTVINFGAELLVWTTVHVPEGSSGLPVDVELETDRGRVWNWSWTPAGPYPVRDSIVAETNDPLRSRIVIPVLREDPDLERPPVRSLDPPVLGYPLDGQVFTFPDTLADLRWSRLGSCTGQVIYEVQISEDPLDFPPGSPVLFQEPFAQLIFDAGGADRGVTIYWRVRVKDGDLLRPWSRWSDVRAIRHD